MADNTKNIFPGGLALAFTIGTFLYGPIDLPRAVYNAFTGDTPVIKRELGNYITANERLQNPGLEKSKFVKDISNELQIPIVNGEINFQDAALDNLFDAAEERADFFDNWVWMRLDGYKNPVLGYNNFK